MINLKKNLIYQIVYEILTIILPIITTPYVSRVLGVEGIGIYSYTFTIANYFVLFCSLGIKNYGNREIARNRNDVSKLNETFTSLLVLHFIISFAVLVLYIIYIIYIVDEGQILYFLVQGIYIISAFIDISWFFFGIEKFKITVLTNIIIKIFTIIFVFLFVNQPSDLLIYLIILAVGTLFGQLYLWMHIKKYVSFCKVSWQMVFSHLPQMLVLFIPTVAISLYNYMDKIMVGSISGTIQLGLYENSEKVIFLATNVIASIGTVMLPRMSNIAASGDVKKMEKYIERSMLFVLCLSFALSFGIMGISKVFSPVFWGEDFSDCSVLLRLLGITLPFKGFANVLRTQFLIPNKRDKEYTLSVCIGAVLNLIFNFLYIPSLHSIGAAIGTIVAETSVCITQMWFCRNELKIKDYLIESIPFIIIGTIMFVVVDLIGRIMRASITTLVVQVITGGLLFVSFCLIYFAKHKNGIYFDFIKEFLSKNRT